MFTKYVGAGALCVGLLLCAGAQNDGWETYVNQRFEYSVDYSKPLLKALPETGNGDGRVFAARAGKASIAVYGSYVDPEVMSAAERAKDPRRSAWVRRMW